MSSGSSALYDLAIFEPNYISFLKIHGYAEISKVEVLCDCKNSLFVGLPIVKLIPI